MSARGPLTGVREKHAGTGSPNFGYHASGAPFNPSTNGYLTTIERIDYSNDTAIASLKGPLNAARYSMGATGNQNFGYFGGGHGSSGRATTVDRVDYSNDTATASPKGPLSLKRREHGSTGNSDFGYSGGGYNSVPGSNNWLF